MSEVFEFGPLSLFCRFGMAIGHEAIIETYNKVKFPYNINKLTAKIAHEALSNLNLMQDNVAQIHQQKERLIKELEKLPSVRKVRGTVFSEDLTLKQFQMIHKSCVQAKMFVIL